MATGRYVIRWLPIAGLLALSATVAQPEPAAELPPALDSGALLGFDSAQRHYRLYLEDIAVRRDRDAETANRVDTASAL